MQLAWEDLQRPTVARDMSIAKAGLGGGVCLGLFGDHKRKGLGFFLQLVFNCRLKRGAPFFVVFFFSAKIPPEKDVGFFPPSVSYSFVCLQSLAWKPGSAVWGHCWGAVPQLHSVVLLKFSMKHGAFFFSAAPCLSSPLWSRDPSTVC